LDPSTIPQRIYGSKLVIGNFADFPGGVTLKCGR
jgi:hypothetical protein